MKFYFFQVLLITLNLSNITCYEEWDKLIPMIDKNTKNFKKADHVFFSHLFKTGGSELLAQSVLPLSVAHNVSLMVSYDPKHKIHECHKPNSEFAHCKIIQKCDDPKWLYGHNVKYNTHWHDQILKADNYRYVIMTRDPVMRMISLYFHVRSENSGIAQDFYDFAEEFQYHGVDDFLPNISNLNNWMEIMANRYLILLNEEYDTSVSMLEAALGYKISNLTMGHKNNARSHNQDGTMIDYQQVSAVRQLPGFKKQYLTHDMLLTFFEIQKRVLLE